MIARPLRRLTAAYRAGAIFTMNSLVALLLVNLALACGFAVKDAQARRAAAAESGPWFAPDGRALPKGRRTQYQLLWFDYNAYGGASQEEVARVLEDFAGLASLGFAYEPFVAASEPLYASTNVNIVADEVGAPMRQSGSRFRGNGSSIVFVLGGSTTFGYNVPDRAAWPAALEEILNEQAERAGFQATIEVRNYGRAFYYPYQEALLLLDLLRLGHRPSLVLFMDGFNLGEESDSPVVSRQFLDRFAGSQNEGPPSLLTALGTTPMGRFATALQRRLSGAPPGPSRSAAAPADPRLVANRFIQSKHLAAAVCRQYGIPVMFFLQPIAPHGYSPALYRDPALVARLLGPRTAAIEELARSYAGERDVTSLMGLFQEWGERKAILDDCHYSPAFNRFLAERVAARLDLAALTSRPYVLRREEATGVRRTFAEDYASAVHGRHRER